MADLVDGERQALGVDDLDASAVGAVAEHDLLVEQHPVAGDVGDLDPHRAVEEAAQHRRPLDQQAPGGPGRPSRTAVNAQM